MESIESTELVKYFRNKRVFEPATSCVINQDATKAPVTEVILKLTPIHTSAVFQIF